MDLNQKHLLKLIHNSSIKDEKKNFKLPTTTLPLLSLTRKQSSIMNSAINSDSPTINFGEDNKNKTPNSGSIFNMQKGKKPVRDQEEEELCEEACQNGKESPKFNC